MTGTKRYGEKIHNAIKAVARLHTDTSKLLRECDGTIGKGRDLHSISSCPCWRRYAK